MDEAVVLAGVVSFDGVEESEIGAAEEKWVERQERSNNVNMAMGLRLDMNDGI